LLRQSQDADEYAFALGALSHYTADIDGHPAVNEAVALGYPKLRARYGKSVRYAQDTSAHLKTEFGFDTLQVAKGRYASEQYHDFIGFKVAEPLLERTFPLVYGLELKDVLAHQALAIGSYRFAVSQLIPEMTKVALKTHKKSLMRETPNFSRRKFLYHLSHSAYQKEWGKSYEEPSVGTRILAGLLRFMPKIGPFKGVGFDNPTPTTEDLYIKSINATVDQYRVYLAEVGRGTLVLPDRDLDDGATTAASEYTLADEAYADLLVQLAAGQFKDTSEQLRNNILKFYSNLSLPIETKTDTVRWQAVLTDLEALRAVTPSLVAEHPAALSIETVAQHQPAPRE
jgi:hypothetical protein